MFPSLVVVFLIMTCALHYWYKRRRLWYLASKIPGPPTVPLLGNSLCFVGTPTQVFKNASQIVRNWSPCFRVWLGPLLFIGLSDPRDIEVVLRNTEHFNKGWVYNFLRPWLGNGLITSSGERWHKHRKLITPTFHFKILEQFVPIFEANCNILVSKLKEKADNGPINISEYMELYSLDTICETAMGYRPNGQINKHNPYVEATKRVSQILHTRMVKAWLHSDFVFNWTSLAQQLKDALRVIHGVSNDIIIRKKEEIKGKTIESLEVDELGMKKKLAFLDHLLLNSGDETLTVQDIREEVDTFLFTGHDTTTSLLSFALFLLGHHPKQQEEAYMEVKSIVGDSDRAITYKDLGNLKYIERCLLETLRIYPTVAALSRTCTKEIQMRDHIIPAGSMIIILIMKMHSNPEYFPNPKVFDPDRFLPENSAKRHPYSFIPFSAGPRNCIGQKYGMLQAKFILATILRNFHVTAACKPGELHYVSHIVTKSENGVPIKLTLRKK